MSKNAIQQSIRETVAWFSCVRRPLTVQELYENLWSTPCSFQVFETALYEMIDNKELLIYKRHVVFQKEEVIDFEARNAFRHQYEQKEKKIRAWLRHFPFVVSVYTVNSGAYKAWNSSSDLDLLIVTRKYTLWFTRFIITLFFSFLRWRRHHKKIIGRICLSFFLTEDMLDIEHLKQTKHTDIYLIYWIVWARPLIHCRSVGTLLHHNHWVRDYVPHIRRFKMSKVTKFSFFAHTLEALLKYTGIAYMCNFLLRVWLFPRALKKHKQSTKHASVVISDSILKFHEHDRRKEYYEKWKSVLDD